VSSPHLTFAVCSLFWWGPCRCLEATIGKSLVVLEMDVQPYTMTASLK
ncbi:hypothetical protein GBAR_LOCUS25581, partial [Geodia barretti]